MPPVSGSQLLVDMVERGLTAFRAPEQDRRDPDGPWQKFFRRIDARRSVPPNRSSPVTEWINVKGLARSFFSNLVRLVKHRHFILLCLTSSIIVRLLWVALVHSYPVSDFAWYYQRGCDMAMGRGYTVGGMPTAYWPVGYPAFLASIFWVLGPDLVYAKLANVLLYIGILYLSYAIARELFSSELTGRMTLLLLAFYPNHIAYSSLVSTETLYLFLLLLGAAALILRPGDGIWKAVSTGAIFGLACLVKPQTIFIPLLLILVLYLRRAGTGRLLKMVLTVYLALGATILPWTVRNYHAFDSLIYVSNNGGVTLFIGNNPHADGTYMPFDEKLKSLLPLSPDDDEHDVDVKARNYAVNYMLEHPAKTLRFCAIKLYYVYREDVEGIQWNHGAMKWDKSSQPSHELRFLIGVAQNYYICTMAAFAISLFVLFRRGGESGTVPIVGLWIIAYFSIIYMVTIGISRFHFPLIPWILMYVSSLFEWIVSRLGIDPRLSGQGHTPTPPLNG